MRYVTLGNCDRRFLYLAQLSLPAFLAGTVKRLLKSGRNLCAENSLASSMPSRSRFCGLDLAETRVYASAVSGNFTGARMREACFRVEAVMEKAEISKKKKDEDRKTWDEWFENKGVGDDFMNDRDQPGHREREEF